MPISSRNRAIAFFIVLGACSVAVALALQIYPHRPGKAVQARFSTLDPALQALVLAGGLTLISVLGPDGVPPFIYFQF